jgi:uncharacterized membrane protein
MTQLEQQPSSTPQAKPIARWIRIGSASITLGLAMALSIIWWWLAQGDALHKADLFGYAICHRIPERSFIIAGRQLPLCARCTGIYLGVFSTFLTMTLLRRWRHAQLPSPLLLAVLFAFVVGMGVDGLNSYITFFPGMPHLYEPQNWLRLATGLLHGIALSSLIFPIFNQTLWDQVVWAPALRNLSELGLVVLIGVAGIGLTLLQTPLLLYPLALIGSGGVLTMLTIINTVIVVTALRQENSIHTWWQVLRPLAVGMVLALIQVSALDLFRAYVTMAFNLPF